MPPATTSTTHLYSVCVTQTGERYDCRSSESLLQGMLRLGRKGIPAGCTNGGCGVCKVRILEGQYVRRVMSRAHVSAEEEAAGCALSCRIYPSSDLRLQVIGAMKKNVCRTVAAPLSPNP